jgi:hypothetical protein
MTEMPTFVIYAGVLACAMEVLKRSESCECFP